jgi:hypothetical protein
LSAAGALATGGALTCGPDLDEDTCKFQRDRGTRYKSNEWRGFGCALDGFKHNPSGADSTRCASAFAGKLKKVKADKEIWHDLADDP